MLISPSFLDDRLSLKTANVNFLHIMAITNILVPESKVFFLLTLYFLCFGSQIIYATLWVFGMQDQWVPRYLGYLGIRLSSF